MTAVVIPLSWTRPPLTGNRVRGNPYARANEVATAKAQAAAAIREANPTPIDRAEVTLHLRVATWHRRDADGLAPTLKVALDACVAEGVLPDDGFQHVPAVALRIHPPDGKPAAMWLTIEETP